MRRRVLRRGVPGALLLLAVTACGGGSDTAPGPRADACSLISRSTAAEVLGSRVERTQDDSKDLGGDGSNVLDCTWVGKAGHSLVLTAYDQEQRVPSREVLGIPGTRGVVDLPSSQSPFSAEVAVGWDDVRITLGVATNGEWPDGPTLRPALKKAVTEVKANLSQKDFDFHGEGS